MRASVRFTQFGFYSIKQKFDRRVLRSLPRTFHSRSGPWQLQRITKAAYSTALPTKVHNSDYTVSKLFSEDGEPLIRPAAIREACPCDQCVHPSDKQRLFLFSDIPENIGIDSYEVDATGTHIINWRNDIPGFENHVSKFSIDQIRRLWQVYPGELLSMNKQPRRLWDGNDFSVQDATISFPGFTTNDTVLAHALRLLWRDGLVFVNDIPQDESSIVQIAERIGPLRNTFYGKTWNVRSVPDAKNVAYTSRILGFHMDLLYMKESPGIQLLHCLENTCTGGESLFADTFKAADLFITENGQAAFRQLAKKEVRYNYYNDGYTYTHDKPIFDINTRGSRPQHTFQNACNPQLMQQLYRVYWSPPFVGSAVSNSVDTSLQTIKNFADILERKDFATSTKLPAGTCAVFDNMRVVHARSAFDINSGRRWLKGCYLDDQDFYSKAVSLLK